MLWHRTDARLVCCMTNISVLNLSRQCKFLSPIADRQILYVQTVQSPDLTPLTLTESDRHISVLIRHKQKKDSKRVVWSAG